MKEFGKILQELRKERYLTGEELGKILNVTKVAISNWENGNRMPDNLTISHIADYFEVSVDYLLGRTDKMKFSSNEDIKQNSIIPNQNLTFSNRLRKEREKIGLMQKEMAQRLNIPSNTYNGYETGKRIPNLDIIKHIADNLNVSIDYLLERTNIPSINTEKNKLSYNIKTVSRLKLNSIDNISNDGINKINEYIEFIKFQENKIK